jgi:hypothetical protein
MVEVSMIIFILSMRIGEDNENIRRRSKDVKNGYKIRCNKKIARIEWRVWSWLRMNADRMLNTCKSMRRSTSVEGIMADGWVTRKELAS